MINCRKSTRYDLCFSSMIYDTKYAARRLSTPSWGSADKHRPFATEWLWYWLDDDDSWQLYEKLNQMEESYQAGDEEYKFTEIWNYTLFFQGMLDSCIWLISRL